MPSELRVSEVPARPAIDISAKPADTLAVELQLWWKASRARPVGATSALVAVHGAPVGPTSTYYHVPMCGLPIG